GDDGATGLPEAARDMSATGRHVEGGDPGSRLAPLDEQVEVFTAAVHRALAECLRSLRPKVLGHAASSTARRAASSIVGSTWRLAGAASPRIRRPSSAFVPSSRTTIGCEIDI